LPELFCWMYSCTPVFCQEGSPSKYFA
jgi:hypothetical protein